MTLSLKHDSSIQMKINRNFDSSSCSAVQSALASSVQSITIMSAELITAMVDMTGEELY